MGREKKGNTSEKVKKKLQAERVQPRGGAMKWTVGANKTEDIHWLVSGNKHGIHLPVQESVLN